MRRDVPSGTIGLRCRPIRTLERRRWPAAARKGKSFEIRKTGDARARNRETRNGSRPSDENALTTERPRDIGAGDWGGDAEIQVSPRK